MNVKSKPWTQVKRTKRQKELTECLCKDKQSLYRPLIENIVLIEEKLDRIKVYPFLLIKGDRQIETPASKVYKSLQVEYLSLLKAFDMAMGGEVDEKTSPFREYLATCGLKNTEKQ